jgi:hypothetical protein
MSDQQDTKRSEADAELEREILEGRKFTLEEAIARLAGPGAMKGESPITRMQQAETEIGSWLRSHLGDSGGSLEVVLHRRVKGSELLLNNFDRPLVVDADLEWSRLMGERPYLERAGAPCHPDDPYTVESVRNALSELLTQLATESP